jgi:hypothetical protein
LRNAEAKVFIVIKEKTTFFLDLASELTVLYGVEAVADGVN